MSDTIDSLANLLLLARDSRVILWPDDGKIHHRSPDPLKPELRDLILANKPALIAHLAKWDRKEARRLCFEADGLVCELGVSGLDAEIQRAAALCEWASRCHVMAGVRKGCALVEDRARKLAANQVRSNAA